MGSSIGYSIVISNTDRHKVVEYSEYGIIKYVENETIDYW